MNRYTPVFSAALLVFTLLNEPLAATLPMLLAIAIHESAHLASVFLCGGQLRFVRTDAIGIAIRYDPTALSYQKEVVVALSGAFANFLSAAVARRFFPGSFTFLFFSLSLGVLNLLPIHSLDGGDALYAMIASRSSPQRAYQVLKVVSAVFSVLLFILAAYLQIALHGNLSLFFLALLLFFRIFREDLS